MKLFIGAVLFSLYTLTSATDTVHYHNNVTCLAEVIFRESRGEPYKGKLAVGQVVVNRVNSALYPATICSVVFQKYQFSWTDKFKRFKAPREFRYIAEKVISGTHELKNFSATHFHAKRVEPKWGRKSKRVAIIGNHIFYKL